ncbi:ion channel [Halalkalicoccus ordinarius]|uniref:ion channel n=1 Tax=Halalkalicoccus ordinarius TaxID=3116651 RepID=UPI00300F6CAB
MNPFYLLLGTGLLIASIVDLLWTALWVDGGAGPLSSRLSAGTWSGLKTVGSDHPRVLSLAGPLILTLSIVMWIGLIWAGWTFVFAAGGERALIPMNAPNSPLTWPGRGYYVAYTMFTDGNGDFAPNGAPWQIASALTTASGMLFVTIAVSYILSVLGAVSDKRSFASSVTGLGSRGEAFVRTGWDGEDLNQLDLPLNSLASDVNRLAEQHKSYPILHYYHSERDADASKMAVAIFDDALTLIRFGVPEEHKPNTALVEDARSSTFDYLQTLDNAFIDPADQLPPAPDLDRLRDAGIPTVSDEEFDDAMEDLDERRRRLLAMIEADARYWPPVEDE